MGILSGSSGKKRKKSSSHSIFGGSSFKRGKGLMSTSTRIHIGGGHSSRGHGILSGSSTKRSATTRRGRGKTKKIQQMIQTKGSLLSSKIKSKIHERAPMVKQKAKEGIGKIGSAIGAGLKKLQKKESKPGLTTKELYNKEMAKKHGIESTKDLYNKNKKIIPNSSKEEEILNTGDKNPKIITEKEEKITPALNPPKLRKETPEYLVKEEEW